MRRFAITRTAAVTVTSMVLVTLVFAFWAYKRRWISDDGLIFVRIVRQILDGNGPVFNASERAEANTSALWPWLLALVAWITRASVAHVAVFSGIVCAIVGVALALDGTRRWHRDRGSDAMLVPGGVLVILGVYAFWDYASSGLETGLATLWLGASWWLLVTLHAEAPRRAQLVRAFVFGLGPLVRPDLALTSAVFLAAEWAICRPPWRRTALLAAAAIALPVAYEIFRAGFYGALVPLPALAKSATSSSWGRGFAYLMDFERVYRLWLPMLALAALLVVSLERLRSLASRDRVLLATPVIAGALMVIYVVRVGGDFMHGRMMLPATFVLLMPSMLLPLRRFVIPSFTVLALWSVYTARTMNDHHNHSTSALIGDERVGYVHWTSTWNPIAERPFFEAARPAATMVEDAIREHRRLMVSEGGVTFQLGAHVPANIVYIAGRLGTGGVVAPLDDGFVGDTLGLSNPLGARITMTWPTEPAGHQKLLPWAWLYADLIEPAGDIASGAALIEVHAARHAMSCGELGELMRSVREPMTAGRFIDNLFGSIRRTRLVIPSDPVDAEWKFCGAAATAPRVSASSSYDYDGWSPSNIIDGLRESLPNGGPLGYSSALGNHADHEEWIEIRFHSAMPISKVVVHPRSDAGQVGVGFPVAFAIELGVGGIWVPEATHVQPAPPPGAVSISLPTREITDRVRLRATQLREVGTDGYVMQLAEIEVLP